MKAHLCPLRLVFCLLFLFATGNLRLRAENADVRARRIVKQMTLQDKITELHGVGEEIAELYIGLPSTADVPQPPKQLKGFQKISVKAGKTRHIRLELDARALSYWNTANHDWEILPGTYRIMVGGSSSDLPLQDTFSVSSAL